MNLEERIRARAQQIWKDEGCPEGRAEAHWDMARELVAIEDNQNSTLRPVGIPRSIGPAGEPIEPIQALKNQGEFPTLADQGEESARPTPGGGLSKSKLPPDSNLAFAQRQGLNGAIPREQWINWNLVWAGIILVGAWLVYRVGRNESGAKRRP